MRVEPPTGDELRDLLTAVKSRVLADASEKRQKRTRLGITGILLAGVAVLGVGGAGAALATSLSSGVFHPIPHSTHHPSDPPQPTSRPGTGAQIQPSQAPLDQLWAIADSEVAEDSTGVGEGMGDFASAIEARCYPLLSAKDAADLASLRAAYESARGGAAMAPARAYFERATKLCM